MKLRYCSMRPGAALPPPGGSVSSSVHPGGKKDLGPGPGRLLMELVHLASQYVVGDELVDGELEAS